MNQNIKTPKQGMNPDRFVFIIGAMKSGTTSLFDILGQHPEICPAKIKEPGFFTSDDCRQRLQNYLNLWDWNKDKHKLALESSVSYTQVPIIKDVPERMAKINLGKYRFIYMMRNPISRIESQVRHGLFAGWGSSLDTGVSDDLVEFSRYAMQMDQYLKYFPKDMILPITLEEFKADPYRVLERICEFLQIDKDYKFSHVEAPRNSGDFFNTPPILRKLSQSWLGRQVVRKLFPFQFKNWLRSKLAKAGKKNGMKADLGRWKLTENEKNEIIQKLLPDLERLRSEYAIDIYKYWKIPSEPTKIN